MKCSSRRNCNSGDYMLIESLQLGLNEVQLPKELQRWVAGVLDELAEASMKCSSRRNCNGPWRNWHRTRCWKPQ